jgi:TorA maturation chaperone TorD
MVQPNGDFELSAADIASQRASSYLLLSQLFLRSPRVDFLKELSASLSSTQDLPEELAVIKQLLSEVDDLEGLSLNLRKDYTRLFLGIKPGYSPPPPYESVYRGEGKLMGVATVDVARRYWAWGFDPARALGYRGPPDHIGVELAFMSHLCRLEEEAWRQRDRRKAERILKAERGFLQDHLAAWAPKLLSTVEREARTDFYKSVSRLAKRFLELDASYVSDLLEELKELQRGAAEGGS